MRASDYPYVALKQSCKYNAAKGVVNTAGFTAIASGDVNGILNAVAQQPVSIGMSAFCGAFMQYKGGIITTSPCGTYLNHAVLIVGYGSESGKDFWIVKNSWGTAWGEGGYFRIQRTTGVGLLGINKLAAYPRM